MKRYRPYYFDPVSVTGYGATMRENALGDWVSFEDHEAELAGVKGAHAEDYAEQQQEIAQLRGTLSLAEERLALLTCHPDPTGKTREPPHCPSCSCGLTTP